MMTNVICSFAVQLFPDLMIPAAGLGLILFALGWGSRLGPRPVEFGLGKLGFNLRADLVTILVLIGAAFVGSGLYFKYLEQRKTFLDQEKEVNATQVQAVLEKFVGALHKYNLGLTLIFPEGMDPRYLRDKISVNLTKKNESAPRTLSKNEMDIRVGFGNDISVFLAGLDEGDNLRIIAKESETEWWESADIEVPKTQIRMTKQIEPGAPQ